MNTGKWTALIALLILGLAFFAGCPGGGGGPNSNPGRQPESNGPFNISSAVEGKNKNLGTISGLPAQAMYGDPITFTVSVSGNGKILSVAEDFGASVSKTDTGYSFVMPRRAVNIVATIGQEPSGYQDLETFAYKGVGDEPITSPLLGFGYDQDPYWGSDDVGPQGIGFFSGGAVGALLFAPEGIWDTAADPPGPQDGVDPVTKKYGYVTMYYPVEHGLWNAELGQYDIGSIGRTFRELDDGALIIPWTGTTSPWPGGPGTGDGAQPSHPAPVAIPDGYDGVSFWAKEEGEITGVRTGTNFIGMVLDTGAPKALTSSINFSLDAANEWQQFFIEFGEDFDKTAVSGYYFGIIDGEAPMGGTLWISGMEFFKY